jgi:hypothetical protein
MWFTADIKKIKHVFSKDSCVDMHVYTTILCTYVNMYTCTYIYVYVCMYTCTYMGFLHRHECLKLPYTSFLKASDA